MNATRDWYAVRCIFGFKSPPEMAETYEERITLWQAPSDDEAIALAEREAHDYADDCDAIYLGLAQSYRLVDQPAQGAEVFSLMRDSPLPPDHYRDAFFNAGTERQLRE
jgi:hypothetical protein